MPVLRISRDQRGRRGVLLTVGLALLIAPSSGYTEEPPQAPSRAATDLQAPHYRAQVDRVRIDVIVTDRDGRFVDNLRPEDFILYEDDIPQPVLGFQLVDLAAGEVTDLEATSINPAARTARDAATEPSLKGAIGDTAAEGTVLESDAGDLGAMVFLIDGPSIDPEIRAGFSAAWTQTVDRTKELEIPHAVYFVSSVGRVEEIMSLSSDTGALHAAAEAVGSLPTYGTTTEQRLRELMDAMEDPRAPGTAGWSLKLRSFEAEERARSVDTLELLTRFCEALSTRTGRTALVWVSTGIKLTEGGPAAAVDAAQEAIDDSRPLSPRDTNWAHFTTDSALIALQDHLQDVANSANVSIYSIDPTPLASLRSSAFDASVSANAATESGSGRNAGARSIPRADILSSSLVQSSLEGLRDSLRSAAQATGGMAMINYTDLGVALGRVRDHSSRFYLLAYAPARPAQDGQFHEVRVEVRRPGLTVRERGGYLAIPTPEREARAVAAAMALPGAARALRIEAEAYRRWSPAGQLDLQIGVNIDNLGAAVQPVPELDFFLVVFDSQGRLVREVTRGIRTSVVAPVPGYPSGILPFGQFEAGWWDLDAGVYEVRLVAKEPFSERLGAARLLLEVPPNGGTWLVSDARLGVAAEGASTRPLIGGKAIAGQQVVVFVDVAGGVAPEFSGRIVVAQDTDMGVSSGGLVSRPSPVAGERIDRAFPWAEKEPPGHPQSPEERQAATADPQTLTLAGVLMRRSTGSLHRGALPLPPSIPPGRYSIELRIADPTVGEERTLHLPLEILASSPAPATVR
jgi:VWFA-related protein